MSTECECSESPIFNVPLMLSRFKENLLEQTVEAGKIRMGIVISQYPLLTCYLSNKYSRNFLVSTMIYLQRLKDYEKS